MALNSVVTLNHFDMPMYLADHWDGWLSRKVVIIFYSFVKLSLNVIVEK